MCLHNNTGNNKAVYKLPDLIERACDQESQLNLTVMWRSSWVSQTTSDPSRTTLRWRSSLVKGRRCIWRLEMMAVLMPWFHVQLLHAIIVQFLQECWNNWTIVLDVVSCAVVACCNFCMQLIAHETVSLDDIVKWWSTSEDILNWNVVRWRTSLRNGFMCNSLHMQLFRRPSTVAR